MTWNSLNGASVQSNDLIRVIKLGNNSASFQKFHKVVVVIMFLRFSFELLQVI